MMLSRTIPAYCTIKRCKGTVHRLRTLYRRTACYNIIGFSIVDSIVILRTHRLPIPLQEITYFFPVIKFPII